jgi:hypothetical protein
VTRSDIERDLLEVQAFPELVVHELVDDVQQFLITLENATPARNALGPVLGYYDAYEGPFDAKHGKFVSYQLTYRLRHYDANIAVKRLRIQLFGYFVTHASLRSADFWRYLRFQHREVANFAQQAGYSIATTLDCQVLTPSDIDAGEHSTRKR